MKTFIGTFTVRKWCILLSSGTFSFLASRSIALVVVVVDQVAVSIVLLLLLVIKGGFGLAVARSVVNHAFAVVAFLRTVDTLLAPASKRHVRLLKMSLNRLVHVVRVREVRGVVGVLGLGFGYIEVARSVPIDVLLHAYLPAQPLVRVVLHHLRHAAARPCRFLEVPASISVDVLVHLNGNRISLLLLALFGS